MTKASKQKSAPKKGKSDKYALKVSTVLTADQLLQAAINTPIKKKK